MDGGPKIGSLEQPRSNYRGPQDSPVFPSIHLKKDSKRGPHDQVNSHDQKRLLITAVFSLWVCASHQVCRQLRFTLSEAESLSKQ